MARFFLNADSCEAFSRWVINAEFNDATASFVSPNPP
jgi:hypothetical protein